MTKAPLILFGACDRHNLGDLLLMRIAQALVAPRRVVVAGVAGRDLRPYGGPRTRALARVAQQWGRRHRDAPADLLHVGGELITCSLYEAAVMTLEPAAAAAVIALYDRDPSARQHWAQQVLQLRQRLAYLADKGLFARPGRFLHLALGGVEFARLPPDARAEAVRRLSSSDALTVRDRISRDALARVGIAAGLVPDAAVLTAELFGRRIAAHARAGEAALVAGRFPQGYAAVQFAAEFGDDATLSGLAAALDCIAAQTGWGLVLFRAGAAPWHDDREVYLRLLQRLKAPAHLFDALNIWQICALLSHARLYLGSSLHGRIVAACFGVPGISLVPSVEQMRTGKAAAYLATWHPGEPTAVTPEALPAAVPMALAQPASALAQRQRARQMAFRRLAGPLLARLRTALTER
ncbi:MAG: polysaccharide pyruvyl transferase family protein [Thiobacillaceae bacterium]|nr:polysaccharide pyruvyl transferase family protein [Thiobacillaceae bacterium]